jgi:hypothetical protein
MTRSKYACWLFAALFLGFAPTRLAAQETRAAAIAAAQAEKAQRLEPYQPSKAEDIVLNLKRQFLDTPNGFYPWFDSVYSGGGFTMGAGYRHYYGDRTFGYARGLISLSAYKLIEVGTESLGLSRGRIDFRAFGGWRDATQVSFFGVGGDTPEEAETDFRMKQAYGGAVLRGRGPGVVVYGVGAQYEDYTLEHGQGATPSIEEVFTPESAPGLGENPAFFHTTLTGGIDTRPSPGYARSGGLYAVSYDNFLDTDDTFDFDRLQGEVVQHLPILRENWVISLHGVVRTTLDNEDVVPYFLLPSLGSGSTLRAYPSWRFRDRHSMLMSGEFRWIPSRTFLDMAIFYDTGKVTSRREDLDFSELKSNVGIGVRFHGPNATPLRVELARGSEGFNVVFAGSAAF